jgi:bifunctional oligoribonuclease and PAP phosphatase NrnA
MTNLPNATQEIKKLLVLIKKHSKFVAVAHECPDGDSLGSALAMACVLRKLKKDVLILSDMVPEKYRYLPLIKDVSAKAPADIKDRVALLFDIPTLDRLGAIETTVKKCFSLVNVDHHLSNRLYGAINWIDTKASAVGEQVFELAKKLGVPLDKDIASCLYTSIVTDTGKFEYANTTPRTHRITAELLATGIKHQEITEQIYENYPKEKLALLAGALSSLKLECDGRVAWMAVTQELLNRSGVTIEWTDDIINFARGIRGVEVAVVFKEVCDPAGFRISFRSRKPEVVDVNTIARTFSGGGHKAAAGCNMVGGLQSVSQKVLGEIRNAYNAR